MDTGNELFSVLQGFLVICTFIIIYFLIKSIYYNFISKKRKEDDEHEDKG